MKRQCIRAAMALSRVAAVQHSFHTQISGAGPFIRQGHKLDEIPLIVAAQEIIVMGPVNRLAIFASQILFSIITAPLLIPQFARQRWTRSFVSFCFGRAYGDKYQHVIDSFEGRYDLGMVEALRLVERIAGGAVSTVADCGTGTGHTARQAAAIFPQATFLALDIVREMLVQARDQSKELRANLFFVQADSFALPLEDESVDLILAQNTIPCFSEFERVCRPGGMLVYADSSSGWIAALARRMVKRQALFEKVHGKRVDLGFYVLAQKSTR